jgi:hypothetical protein
MPCSISSGVDAAAENDALKRRRRKNERNRLWMAKKYAENPNKAIASANKWKAKNPEKAKAIKREWEANNREKLNAKARERYDPEKQRERTKKRDPEKEKIRRQKWAMDNPEKVKEAQERYIRENPEKVKRTKKRQTLEIHDSYVAAKLKVPVETLRQYPDLLESHREVIAIKRKLNINQNRRNHEKSN